MSEVLGDPRRFYVVVLFFTSILPFLLATVYGIAVGEGWAFYTAIIFMSAFPVVIGLQDAIIDFVENLEVERKQLIETNRRAAVVAAEGERFLKELVELSDLELSLLSWALDRNLNGLNRGASDPDLQGLISRGMVTPSGNRSAQGFPFEFDESVWVLMTELSDQVFALRDRRRGVSPQHAPNSAAAKRPDITEVLAMIPIMILKGLYTTAFTIIAVFGMWVFYVAAMGFVASILIFGGAGIGAIFGWLFG